MGLLGKGAWRGSAQEWGAATRDRVVDPNLGDVQGGHPACRGTLITIKAVAPSLRAAPGTSTGPVTWGVLCFICNLLPTSQTSCPDPSLWTKPAPSAHPSWCARVLRSLAGRPSRLPRSAPSELPRERRGREQGQNQEQRQMDGWWGGGGTRGRRFSRRRRDRRAEPQGASFCSSFCPDALGGR